ncbi:hypothetical protein AQPE_3548 [Aquipluma nitroreducens]|uniref:Uncharacterized protein n=1 Tax=Aquipluma nitroreducens TaxID=2010828 RepID=A0A5K7SCQ2_9BACT|nr:hypothetical protein AQPE_3548 [Aquipluma nitroreducens]
MVKTQFTIWFLEDIHPGYIKIMFSVENSNWAIYITKFKFRFKKELKNNINRISRLYDITVLCTISEVINSNVKSITG